MWGFSGRLTRAIDGSHVGWDSFPDEPHAVLPPHTQRQLALVRPEGLRVRLSKPSVHRSGSDLPQ